MKWQNFLLIGVSICMILVSAQFAAAQSGSMKPQVVHEAIGEVIDAQENAKYHIFGDITGFTAGRLYGDASSSYQLHLLRNGAGSAQFLILKLSHETQELLRRAIAERIDAVSRGESASTQVIYPITERQWPAPAELKKVVLRDGTTLNGTFARALGDTLIVHTSGGLQISIPDAQIVEVDILRGEIREGQFYRTDPNGTRLLLGPTGRSLNAGQGYFADYFLFFPTLAVGVTDFLALSGGVSLVPGASSQLAYFGPKLTFPISSNVGLATGFLYVAIPEETDDATLGYAVGTFGSNRSALTLGAAFPLTSSDDDPILLIGGETQISNSAKLITENWIITGTTTTFLFSGGVRFFGEKLAVDLALVSSEEFFEGDNGFPFIPWVDFSVVFGK